MDASGSRGFTLRSQHLADMGPHICSAGKQKDRIAAVPPNFDKVFDQVEFKISSGALAVLIRLALNALGRCQHRFSGQRREFLGLFADSFKLLTRMAGR